jgi:hypothetical protein
MLGVNPRHDEDLWGVGCSQRERLPLEDVATLLQLCDHSHSHIVTWNRHRCKQNKEKGGVLVAC